MRQMCNMHSIYRFMGVSIFVAILFLLMACSSSNSNEAAKSSGGNSDGGMKQESLQSDEMGLYNSNSTTSVSFTSGTTGDDAGESSTEQPSDFNSNTSTNSSGFLPQEGTDGFNRKLIYKANLNMEVKDYGDAQTEIRNLTHLSSGYILEFSENKTTHERSGNFVIKIPSQGFISYLDGLEQLDVVSLTRSVQGQDVTEEYIDLNSRLKAKQVVESRLLDFMEKSTKTDELLSFSNELARVQEEIERHKGRIRYLDQNVEFSTVEIRVYEKNSKVSSQSEEQKAFSERISGSMKSSLHYLNVFFQELIIFFAGALPVLLVISVIVVPILYIIRRNKKL